MNAAPLPPDGTPVRVLLGSHMYATGRTGVVVANEFLNAPLVRLDSGEMTIAFDWAVLSEAGAGA